MNFTSIEILPIENNDQLILVGDDHGNVYTVGEFFWYFFSLSKNSFF